MNSYACIGYPHKESENNIGCMIFVLYLDASAAYFKEMIDAFRTSVGPEILWFANKTLHFVLILNTILYITYLLKIYIRHVRIINITHILK